ncbi:hypothetical protein HMPREF2884_04760 [Rothia sp. HMSC073B08]|nr:hypothetical protein HMPREF2884_04760 [Rothia sp. HMSC073B08]
MKLLHTFLMQTIQKVMLSTCYLRAIIKSRLNKSLHPMVEYLLFLRDACFLTLNPNSYQLSKKKSK